MSAAVDACAKLDVRCSRMDAASLPEARALLGDFLAGDAHYRASAAAYGDGGGPALARALGLFLERPELGFVWIARVRDEMRDTLAGACVVCYAISTSRGGLVAKLDDVTIDARWQGRGVGSAMLDALARELLRNGVSRIDTACHQGNTGAWRFYTRLGFRPLDEERIARVLVAEE